MKRVILISIVLLFGLGMIYSAAGNIKVIKPADRDSIAQNQIMSIKWKSQGQLPPQVKIQLVDRTGNHFVKTIAGGTENDLSHQWRIPVNLNPGPYRVKIISIGSNVTALSGLFKIVPKSTQPTPTWEAPNYAMISSLKVNQQNPANSCTNTTQRAKVNLSEGFHIWVTATSIIQPIKYKYRIELTNPETSYEYTVYDGDWTNQSLLNFNPSEDLIMNTVFPGGVSGPSIPLSVLGAVTVWVKNDAQTLPPKYKVMCIRLWL